MALVLPIVVSMESSRLLCIPHQRTFCKRLLWLTGPRAQATIPCATSRRHLRRRPFGFPEEAATTKKGHRYDSEDFPADHHLHDQDKVIITLDIQELRKRAATLTRAGKQALDRTAIRALRLGKALVRDSSEFLTDLRSSVAVQRDKRVVISFKRSSIEFAANLLLWSLLLVAVSKIFVKAAKKYRWGWEESFGSRSVVKRDRSLGGREVFVGKSDGNNSVSRHQKVFKVKRQANPLDAVEVLRSEKDMAKAKQKSSRSPEKSKVRLPGWWVYPEPHGTLPNLQLNDAQEEASYLANALSEKRLSGKDFEEDDILQLRRLCRYSGAKVKLDTVNVRDALYRAAINVVLCSCGNDESSAVLIGENAVQLLTGLADNIELEAERAATMVNAAVAARTRSIFLQAWALFAQDKPSEAEREIGQLLRIHSVFPSDQDSPEMEMVAEGLGRHLSLDERKLLLEMYVKAGGGATERVASEALGLFSSNKRAL